MKKIIFLLFIIISSGVAAWYIFFFDNVVTQGNAYGFNIGMEKQNAIKVIKEEYSDSRNIIILSPGIYKDNIDDVKNINANTLVASDVDVMNVWQLRFDGKETNVLVLFFEDSKLIKMARYRRLFIP
jgi:hypothetical protein